MAPRTEFLATPGQNCLKVIKPGLTRENRDEWGPLPSRSGRKIFFISQSIIFAHFRKEKDIKDHYNPLFPKFQFPWTCHKLSNAGPHHIQLVISCGRWRVWRLLRRVRRHKTSKFSSLLCWTANLLFVMLKWRVIHSMRKYGSVWSQPLITTAPYTPNSYMSFRFCPCRNTLQSAYSFADLTLHIV